MQKNQKMPSCVMRFCTNYTNKTSKSQGITYHSFPLNELRRLKWVDIVRKQRKQDDWLPNNSSKICSIHFNNDDKYKSNKGFTLLKKSALPVLETSHPSPPATYCSENISEDRVPVSKECNCSKMSAATDLETTHSLRALACSEVKKHLNSSNLLKNSALPVLEVSHSLQPAPAFLNNPFEVESSNLNSLNILKDSTAPVLEVSHSSQPAPACSNNLSEVESSNLDLSDILKNSTVPVLEVCHSSQPAPTSPNSLDNERISDMESIFETPRKTALKKCMRKLSLQKQILINKTRNLTKRNKRLEKKVASMKTILKHLKKKAYISDEHFTELNLKSETLDMFNRIVSKKQSKKSFRRKYPPALRKFALTLNFYSPAAYKYVRRVFHTALPHPRILGKWYENCLILPGFTTQAFDMLKKKHELSGKRMTCVLVADEMALRHQSKWTGRKTEGVVDFGGTSDSKVIATEAYVFLLVALDENWKLPVGYFFVKGVSAETRAHLITSCISKSFESGVDVVAVTFDGCPANFSAANILGCDLRDPNLLKTSFKHPDCDKKVVVLFDPCHMIKLVRNTFESKRIIFNQYDKEIKWHLLVNLNNIQKDQGLNFANKLSERHLKFRNEIMKVRLATQLLSKSVANALELCEQLSISSRFKDTAATVEFIKIFNDLFDVFNSRSVDIFGFKKPICPQNAKDILNFLDKAKQYILSLKIYNKTKKQVKRRIVFSISKKSLVDCKCKSGFLGFLVCIESLKYLYSSIVVDRPVLRYISTYRLSQDHIEILFGVIRRHGGYNNNPNVIQFKGIYKKILNHLELRSGFSGNCVPLESVPILNCSSAVSNINWSSSKRASIISDDEFDPLEGTEHENNMKSDKISQDNVNIFAEVLNNDSSPDYVKQIVGYISGWVARKLVSILKCEVCIQSLFTSEKMWFHKLITIKDMGGLCYSTESTFIVCLKSENILKAHIKEKGLYFTKENQIDLVKNRILKSFINSNIFNDLNDHALTQPPTFNHRLHLIKAIIEKYLNVRLHSEHKNNPELKKKSKRQKRNKLNLFEGM